MLSFVLSSWIKRGGSLAATAATKPSMVVNLLMAGMAHFTYVALIVVLVITGVGVPIPEDIPLVLSGYLCNHEHSPIKQIPYWIDVDGDGVKEAVPRRIPNLYLMIVAGMIGVLVGDSIVFSIGRRGIESNNVVARHLRKVMHSKRREKVERHFATHGNLTVLVGRFTPGARSMVFAFAGLSKMSYARFIMIDGAGAAISVPLFVYLGYHFAANIRGVFGFIDSIKHILFPVLVLIGVVIAVSYWLRRRKRRAANTGGA